MIKAVKTKYYKRHPQVRIQITGTKQINQVLVDDSVEKCIERFEKNHKAYRVAEVVYVDQKLGPVVMRRVRVRGKDKYIKTRLKTFFPNT